MKKTLALVLSILMVIALVPAFAAAEGDVITLYVTDWESDSMNADIQKACDEIFSVEHPNIKVVVLSGSYSDYGQQIVSMIQAGDDLDVFQQGYGDTVSNYQKGLIYDWSEYVAKDEEFMAGFYPGSMTGFTWRNVITGLPGLGNVYGFFYNKDIIAEKGLVEPTVDWTWDDFFTLAEGLKDVENGVYGCYGFTPDVFGLNQISASNGGEIYVDDFTDTTKVIVDDKLVEAAELIAGYIADGTIPPRTYEGTDLQSNFEAGTIGLLYYGQWEVNTLMKNCPDLNWGYAPVPNGTAGRANTYDFVGWAAKKDLAHPDETWELMKFLSSYCYETVLVNNPVAACAHEASAQVFFDTLIAAGHQEAADTVAALMANPVKTPVRFSSSWRDDAGKIWNVAYNNILDGKGGSAEDLYKLAEDVNLLIEDEQ